MKRDIHPTFEDPKSGHLGARLPATDLLNLPLRAELVRGDTVIRYADSNFNPGKPPTDEDLLGRFINLRSASPRAILNFARKNGTLAVDSDGYLMELCQGEHEESIELWRLFSSAANALLIVASCSIEAVKRDPRSLKPRRVSGTRYSVSEELKKSRRQKDIGEKVVWDAAFFDADVSAPKDALTAVQMVRSAALRWLRLTKPTVDLTWKGNRWVVGMDFGGRLLPRIAMQLMTVLGDSTGWMICDGCHQYYVRHRLHRRPKPGQNNFCESCGGRAASRLSTERWRKKSKTVNEEAKPNV